MDINHIQSVCEALVQKANQEHFLESTVDEIEQQADRFVEDFATEHGLKAHTLSAYRWYFQTDEGLLEDGLIELICKTNPLTRRGHCTFECVEVSGIHASEKSDRTQG